MAHLLEHMLFKGTPTIADPKAELTKRGMRFNASTWYDRTNYHETFSASPADLQWALAMEADRMVNAKVARADLDSEMTVVRNEMEMGENSPVERLLERLTGAAYDWHNYGKETIGARSDVEGVDIGRCRRTTAPITSPTTPCWSSRAKFDPDETLAGSRSPSVRSEARPRAAAALHARAGAGRRAQRHDPARRRHAAHRHPLPHRARRASGRGRRRRARQSDDRRAGGPALQALVETKKASAVQSFAPGCTTRASSRSLRSCSLPIRWRPRGARWRRRWRDRQGAITTVEVDRVRAKALRDFDEILADPTHLGVALSEAVALGDWRLFFSRATAGAR